MQKLGYLPATPSETASSAWSFGITEKSVEKEEHV